ncbi:MAG: uncharacterized protein A8A55_1843 [Amphiamblys sp. WSBS2006]|nr:MAG: uncharacterized protein A8A55_1843 [Amphiamblys sp. WSBS2006]
MSSNKDGGVGGSTDTHELVPFLQQVVGRISAESSADTQHKRTASQMGTLLHAIQTIPDDQSDYLRLLDGMERILGQQPTQTGISSLINRYAGLGWRDVGRAYRPMTKTNGHFGSVYLVDFGGGGRVFSTGGDDGSLKVWCAQTGRLLRCMRGHRRPLCDSTLSPDLETAITCSVDKTLKIWDMETGRVLDEIDDVFAIVSVSYHPLFSPKHPFILYAAEDGTVVLLLWDFKEKRLREEKNIFPCKSIGKDCALSASFSYGGGRFVVGGTDGILRILETPTVKEFLERYSSQVQEVTQATRKGQIALPTRRPGLVSLEEHTGSITCHSFSHDGVFFVSGSADGTSRRWWYDGGERAWMTAEFAVYKKDPLYSDGSSAVCCQREEPVRPVVDGVLLSCDGKYLFSVLRGNTQVQIWDVVSGQLFNVFGFHKEPIEGFDTHPTFPELFLSCSSDGVVVVASVHGEIYMAEKTDGKPLDGRFSETGECFVVSDEHGDVYLYGTGAKMKYEDTPSKQFFQFEMDEADDCGPAPFPQARLYLEGGSVEESTSRKEEILREILKEKRAENKNVKLAHERELCILGLEKEGLDEGRDAVAELQRLKERRKKMLIFEVKKESEAKEEAGEEAPEEAEESEHATRRSARIQERAQDETRRRSRRRQEEPGDLVEETSVFDVESEFVDEGDSASTATTSSDGVSEENIFPEWTKTREPDGFYHPQVCDVVSVSREGYLRFIKKEKRRMFQSGLTKTETYGVIVSVELFDVPPLSFSLAIAETTKETADKLLETGFTLEQFKGSRLVSVIRTVCYYPSDTDFVFLHTPRKERRRSTKREYRNFYKKATEKKKEGRYSYIGIADDANWSRFYFSGVFYAMTLEKIIQRVENSFYRGADGVEWDLCLLLENTTKTHRENTQVVEKSRRLVSALRAALDADRADIYPSSFQVESGEEPLKLEWGRVGSSTSTEALADKETRRERKRRVILNIGKERKRRR